MANAMDSKDKAREMASTAKDETNRVAHAATDATKNVAGEAGAQAAAMLDEAKSQLGSMVDSAKQEVRSQLDDRTHQAAQGLQAFSRQLTALHDGRTQEAGHLGALVGDAQRRVERYAQTLETRGPEGLVQDVAAFARRRPLMFLAAAAATGFAAGRLARAGAAAQRDRQIDARYGRSDGDATRAGSIGITSTSMTGSAGTAPLSPTGARVLGAAE
jgi:hypothetical protein